MTESLPDHPIPRVGRNGVDLWWARRRAVAPHPIRRPIAHVLTVLGFTGDGPTYAFECRADPKDFRKTCAAWTVCEHSCPSGIDPTDGDCAWSPTGRHEWRDGFCWRPARGCAYAHIDAEETDDTIRELINRHRLTRGIYLVEVTRSIDSTFHLTMRLLGQVTTVVGWLPIEPMPLTVRPTTATRYPGYGPEVDVRELIEESLTDTPNAISWGDDEMTVTVDAAEAAKKVIAWVEETYDVPPDQLSFATLPARVRKPGSPRRLGVIGLPVKGDVL